MGPFDRRPEGIQALDDNQLRQILDSLLIYKGKVKGARVVKPQPEWDGYFSRSLANSFVCNFQVISRLQVHPEFGSCLKICR